MDSKAKSLVRGRLFASAIMAGVTVYAAGKGVSLSEEDRAAGEMVLLGLMSGAASLAALLSKLREGRR